MNKDELKNKYSAFIVEISEIMGLGKPIDILKLCKTTDLFFRPLEKRIADLEAQIEKMRNFQNCDYQLHVTDCPIFKSGGHISCKKCPHWILQEIKEND